MAVQNCAIRSASTAPACLYNKVGAVRLFFLSLVVCVWSSMDARFLTKYNTKRHENWPTKLHFWYWSLLRCESVRARARVYFGRKCVSFARFELEADFCCCSVSSCSSFVVICAYNRLYVCCRGSAYSECIIVVGRWFLKRLFVGALCDILGDLTSI